MSELIEYLRDINDNLLVIVKLLERIDMNEKNLNIKGARLIHNSDSLVFNLKKIRKELV